MIEAVFKITYPYGMHARPATVLVAKANSFQSRMTLVYKDNRVNLKSIMGVMSQGIPRFGEFRVIADGRDEVQAMDAIRRTIEDINSNL